MFGIGLSELVFLFVLTLILLGPKRLPMLSKSLSSAVREFQRTLYKDLDDTNGNAANKDDENLNS